MPIVGGPSGTGLEHPEALADLAAELGIDDVVRFVPPVPPAELAVWDAAASLVAVPSYNESFGLVAAEAQAAGTPVVAAAVGGLTTVVADGRSGLLLDTHDPDAWAHALGRVLLDDGLRARLAEGARVRAGAFSWEDTAERTLDVYERARASLRDIRLSVHPPGRGRVVPWSDPAQVLRDYLTDNDLDFEERDGSFSFALPGERKLADAGPGRHRPARARRPRVRLPQPRREPRARLPLAARAQPASTYAVSYAVDHLGDIYLDARLPLAAVTPEEIDRVLGSVLTHADGPFNTILELGFASSIRKEWEWRNLRGEPTRNLDAFRGWLETGETPHPDDP